MPSKSIDLILTATVYMPAPPDEADVWKQLTEEDVLQSLVQHRETPGSGYAVCAPREPRKYTGNMLIKSARKIIDDSVSVDYDTLRAGFDQIATLLNLGDGLPIHETVRAVKDLVDKQRAAGVPPHGRQVEEERSMITKRFPLCETVSKDMLERFLATGEKLSGSAFDRCLSCNSVWTPGHRMVIVDVEVDPTRVPATAVEVSQLLHDQLAKTEARHTNAPFDSIDPSRKTLLDGFQRIANLLRIGDALPISKVLREAEAVIQRPALVTTPNPQATKEVESLRRRLAESVKLAEDRRHTLEERSVRIGNDKHQIDRLTSENRAIQMLVSELCDKIERLEAPIPMILFCPACKERHIDEGYFERKAHTSHSCQNPKCGITWKQAQVPTVGVAHLPGYLNGCTCIFCGPTKHKIAEPFGIDKRRCACGCLAILHHYGRISDHCRGCSTCTGFADAATLEARDGG